MLGITKSIPQRLLVPGLKSQLIFTRNRQEVPIYKMSPEQPVTNRTLGPWPETEEERLRAAKKYNLIPEDYEPYDELDGFGDYPKLPAVGAFNRDKYEDFDDVSDCRNFGEPFHLHNDLYGWEKIDPMESEKIMFKRWPWWRRGVVFFGYPIAIYGIYKFFEWSNIQVNHPWKIRSYNGDRPIYAFPPSASDHDAHHH